MVGGETLGSSHARTPKEGRFASAQRQEGAEFRSKWKLREGQWKGRKAHSETNSLGGLPQGRQELKENGTQKRKRRRKQTGIMRPFVTTSIG